MKYYAVVHKDPNYATSCALEQPCWRYVNADYHKKRGGKDNYFYIINFVMSNAHVLADVFVIFCEILFT